MQWLCRYLWCALPAHRQALRSQRTERHGNRLSKYGSLPCGHVLFKGTWLFKGHGLFTGHALFKGARESPQVDYSEATDKAIDGAISWLLSTDRFAKDGNFLPMAPAPSLRGLLR